MNHFSAEIDLADLKGWNYEPLKYAGRQGYHLMIKSKEGLLRRCSLLFFPPLLGV